MSIRTKHQQFIEKADLEALSSKLKQQVQKDQTGAFWHTEEAFGYLDNQVQKALCDSRYCSHPFAGLTVGVKDLFCIKGLTTTAGSRILEKFTSPYTSTVWNRIEALGGLLGGKLSMDEFAMGSFTHTSYLGKTSIPGFPDHTAGGSSGGSAAAVASGIVDFSLGSDTGGSVRLPASFCSIVGYKPSYGAFSRFGMIPYASSLDQAGIFTRNLDDLKYILEQNIAASADPYDMTCKGLGDYVAGDKKTSKVGYFKEILESQSLQPEVAAAYRDTLKRLENEGIETVPVSISYMDKAAQIYYIIACSEASSNLAKYQGVYFGEPLVDAPLKASFAETLASYRSEFFGSEVQKRIMLGSFILSAENFSAMYEKAWEMRRVLTQSMENVLKEVDMLVLPVSPRTAPRWDEISQMTSAEIYLSDYMTVPFSLAGVPALSLPWYKDARGLGIGMQFVGQKFDDYQLIDRLEHLEYQIAIKEKV